MQPQPPAYEVVTSQQICDQAEAYLARLKEGSSQPGGYLARQLSRSNLAQLMVPEFLEALTRTKLPQIFAESKVRGDGTDWTAIELTLLGGLNVVIPVEIFDNALHRFPFVHSPSFHGHLLYTPGALLRNGRGQTPADWVACVERGGRRINREGFYKLYETRLVPLLIRADEIGREENRNVMITIPGLGCGQFAGPFRGNLASELLIVLKRLLETHGGRFSNLKVLYFDPYRECSEEDNEINGILLRVRPLGLMPEDLQRPQLCRPEEFDPRFEGYVLCSMVAWDHVSWPGNDYWAGSRATDDGVKAAATDTCFKMTGIEGTYSRRYKSYLPPEGCRTWRAVVESHNCELSVADRLRVYSVVE